MTESDTSSSPGEEVHIHAEGRSSENSEFGPPIAIVGTACRFLGAARAIFLIGTPLTR